MEKKILRIFTATGCQPCSDVHDALNNGLTIEGKTETEVNDLNVVIHDVTTEEGFPLISKYQLEKVPTAILEEQKCDIIITDEGVRISCPASTAKTDNTPSESSAS